MFKRKAICASELITWTVGIAVVMVALVTTIRDSWPTKDMATTQPSAATSQPSAAEAEADKIEALKNVKQGDHVYFAGGEIYTVWSNNAGNIMLSGLGLLDWTRNISPWHPWQLVKNVVKVVKRSEREEYRESQALFCDHMAGIRTPTTKPTP